MKHTKGKWKVTRWERENVWGGFETVVTDSRGHGLFSALQFGESKKVEANAKLIAEAPKMFNILKDIAEKGTVSLNTMIHINRTIMDIKEN
tara:strand:+ start:338 stop:610 length:273 start_codon:yes stop_codon:yes gene_type:complete